MATHRTPMHRSCTIDSVFVYKLCVRWCVAVDVCVSRENQERSNYCSPPRRHMSSSPSGRVASDTAVEETEEGLAAEMQSAVPVTTHRAPSARRGVIYFSRVPRNMRPNEVRAHFSVFGEIFRQKFVPFPRTELPGGRLSSLQFKEGWLEFLDVADAKSAVEQTNAEAVDTKRRRLTYGETWNVRFLPNFQWGDLVNEEEGAKRTEKRREFTARAHERQLTEELRRAIEARIKRKRSHSDAPVAETQEAVEVTEDAGEQRRDAKRRRVTGGSGPAAAPAQQRTPSNTVSAASSSKRPRSASEGAQDAPAQAADRFAALRARATRF